MQNNDVFSSMSKAFASALNNPFTGLMVGRVSGSGSTKPIGTSVTSIYSSLFTFRSFIDNESRATCAAFGAPVNAGYILHNEGVIVPGVTTDDFLRQLRFTETANFVKRTFGPRQKEEGRVISSAAPPKEREQAETTEESEKKQEEAPKEAAAPAAPALAPAPVAPAQVEESLVPDLDFAEFIQQVDTVMPLLQSNIRDATEAIRSAKLKEKSEEHERKRNEMLAVLQTERARLDAALKASCDEIDRQAEEAAAEIRSKYEQRIKNAEKKVEAADQAILADANNDPLAEKEKQPEKEQQQQQPQKKEEQPQKKDDDNEKKPTEEQQTQPAQEPEKKQEEQQPQKQEPEKEEKK